MLDGLILEWGVLSLTSSSERRSILMARKAKAIFANETWLVLMGGLFGAFPLA